MMMTTMSIKMSNRIKTKKPEKQMLKWLCTDRCKLLTENDIKAIIEISNILMSQLNYCANIWKIVTMIALIIIIRE